MSLLIVLLIIGGFLLILFVVGLVGNWILKPVSHIVKGKRRPTRFSMVDFLWLSLLAAGVLAPLSKLRAETNQLAQGDNSGIGLVFVVIGALLLFVVTIIWWRGTATLSGLGISDHRRRGVFLLVVIPMAIAIPISILGISGALIEASQNDREAFMVWLAVPFVIALIAYLARHVCKWVAAGATISTTTIGPGMTTQEEVHP